MSWWPFSRTPDIDGPARPVRIEPLDVVQDAPAARGSVPGGKAALVAAAITAAVGAAVPLAERWEGYRGAVYLDPAGIPTQCYGETVHIDPARIYSREECAVKLRARLARIYAPPIIACVPGLTDVRKAQTAGGALVDASYNAGPAAVCASPMARHFRAGRWQEGCEAFSGWYVTARDRRTGQRVRLAGLVARREDERRLCLRGV